MGIKIRNRFPASFAATLGLVLMLSGLATGNALANGPTATPGAGNSISASATLKFRIVVAETLRIGGEQQRQAATAPSITRTVAVHDGRQLITFARP